MHNAFSEVFQKHSKVIIIGSDCPYLTSQHIEQANSILDTADCVIGPALDGGYYLLGLNSIHERLFQNKNWSSSTVLKDSLVDLKQLNLSYQLMESLEDVDSLEAWNRYQKRN